MNLKKLKAFAPKLPTQRNTGSSFQYTHPESGNLVNFLTTLHQTIDRASGNFNNIVVMGDMNINTLGHSSSLDKVEELCDTLGLHNPIKHYNFSPPEVWT